MNILWQEASAYPQSSYMMVSHMIRFEWNGERANVCADARPFTLMGFMSAAFTAEHWTETGHRSDPMLKNKWEFRWGTTFWRPILEWTGTVDDKFYMVTLRFWCRDGAVVRLNQGQHSNMVRSRNGHMILDFYFICNSFRRVMLRKILQLWIKIFWLEDFVKNIVDCSIFA